MRILFIGDISGRPGRETVAKVLPKLKKDHKLDFVIANTENSAGGFGVTREIIDELVSAGVDFFTTGDHVWKVKEFMADLNDKNLPLVRPYNYEATDQLPGKGYEVVDLGSKGRVVVVNLIGQIFMQENVRNPFWFADEMLEDFDKKGIDIKEDIIIVDFHAEATAEKISLAYYLKNKITALIGTHTHVPTADERLIADTAYVSDAGMVGPLDASLWANFDNIFHNFKFPFKKPKEMETSGRMVFNSVLIETKGGKATSIKRVDRILD